MPGAGLSSPPILPLDVDTGARPRASEGFAPVPPREGLMQALVRHYAELIDHVRQHLARRGGDRATAGDVVHDVCVQIAQTPPRQPVRVPLAFLRHVATCRAIDLHRIESGRRAWVQSCETLPEVADDRAAALDPLRVLAGRQGLSLLAAAIDALPPRARDAFVMHRVHQLPQAEVAQRMGISLKAVEKHLRLAQAALRQYVLQDLA